MNTTAADTALSLATARLDAARDADEAAHDAFVALLQSTGAPESHPASIRYSETTAEREAARAAYRVAHRAYRAAHGLPV